MQTHEQSGSQKRPPEDRLMRALTWLMGPEFWRKAAREVVLEPQPSEKKAAKE